MSLDPTVEEQLLLADTFKQRGSKMAPREKVVECLLGAAFVAVTVALLVWLPPRHLDAGLSVACLVTLALASLVRFDSPFGFTVATQVAFVPALFAVPLALVPMTVVVALVLAHLPRILRGEFRPDRLWLVLNNAWFAVGPVAVFGLAQVTPRAAAVWLLLTALAAQFVLDATISYARLWGARDASLSAHLRQSWVYAIDAALSAIGLVIADDLHSRPLAVLAILPLLWLMSTFANERHNRLTSLVELNNAYRGTALVLGDVVEADDGYTGEHCRSVVSLALAVADQLGLELEQQRNLEFGALLHDVGKIAIPKEIINKPDSLDPQEWTIIKTHTIEGQKMLDRVGGFMREVGLIVRSHHERWDGTGYPDRLAGEAIPLESRIVACCDTWNAMRTDRSYRKALPYETALAEMQAHSGSQFDPRVVDALVRVLQAEAAQTAAAARSVPRPKAAETVTAPRLA